MRRRATRILQQLKQVTAKGGRLITGGPSPLFDVVMSTLSGRVSERRLNMLNRAATHISKEVRLDRLARSAAVARSEAGRDLLVLDGSKSTLNFSDIQDVIDGYTANPSATTSTLGQLGFAAAINLAWLLSVQKLHDRDQRDAQVLYDWCRTQRRGKRLPTRHQRAHIELLLASGHYERAATELAALEETSAVATMLRADSVNPFMRNRRSTSEPQWLDTVNALWQAEDLAALRLGNDASALPYDRLETEATSPVNSCERVTVVMSAYRPDARMLAALKSVLASTWGNLEVLLCDDASGAEYDAMLGAAAALDPRVTVTRMPTNGGTYRIRNHAMHVATGDFITFHDSDDWMHPQRIELQASHLVANPRAVANASRSARVTELMQFSHSRNLGAQICEPSLMLRRELAIRTVGFFDTLRKGADAEYRRRLESAIEFPTPVVGKAPLTLQLIVDGSLSNTDIVRHWFQSDRRIHRSCFEQWHRECRADGTPPVLADEVPRAEHPIYAPPGMLKQAPCDHYDVVIASNWLEDGTWEVAEPSLVRMAESLLAEGRTVAITHVPDLAPLFSMRLALASTVSRMLNHTALEYVNPDDVVKASVLVVHEGPRLNAHPSGIDFTHTVKVERARRRTRADVTDAVRSLLEQ